MKTTFNDWQPTHIIQHDGTFAVMLPDGDETGPLYTYDEWIHGDYADYEFTSDGCLFQGQPFAGTFWSLDLIAKRLGYETILIKDDQIVGIGSADPFDRSRDEQFFFVAYDLNELINCKREN